MTTREMTAGADTLAWDIFRADNSNLPEERLKADFPARAEYALHIAKELRASGYQKPRTITTIEELYELGLGSVVRSEKVHYLVAHKEDGDAGRHGWAAAGTSQIPVDLSSWLPVTVLHEPQEES